MIISLLLLTQEHYSISVGKAMWAMFPYAVCTLNFLSGGKRKKENCAALRAALPSSLSKNDDIFTGHYQSALLSVSW